MVVIFCGGGQYTRRLYLGAHITPNSVLIKYAESIIIHKLLYFES
jgi:hypothetical protein